MAPARVAVINDDPDAGEILSRVLEQDGLLVGRLFDHDAALGPLTTEPPDVVIIDLLASNNAAPITLLNAIRNHTSPALANVRVIVIGQPKANALMAWNSAADGFVSRPFRATAIVEEVHRVMDRSEGERAPFRVHAHQNALGGPA